MNNKICGVEEKDIKSAFFKGKLNLLLNEMQASGGISSVDDAKKLKEYLETLKKQNDSVIEEMKNGFSSDLGMDDIKPPSVDELVGKEKEDFYIWLEQKDSVLNQVRSKMSAVRNKISREKEVNVKELQDLAFDLSFYRNWISQDVVYKRQLWKQRLTRIIDDYGVSRKEAEDRSELTKEYRDYKLASNFQENIDDFIISARKGYTDL